MQLEGIHHITAITGDAPRNVDFYTRVLGLRLVKRTVNQDDPSVYHLFYGDEEGSPGLDLTFFECPGAARGRAGAGMVHRILWRVAGPEAIAFWARRLEAEGVDMRREDGRLLFADPEGLGHELVVPVSGDAPLVARHPEIPADVALQGFEGVRAYGADPAASERLLSALGFRAAAEGYEARGRRRGAVYVYDRPPEARGLQGAGTVHHVAWSSTIADHAAWRERVAAGGGRPTPVIDRFYFRSIYFREPSGVLFEIATMGPGFAVDEPQESLGERLSLPPGHEHLRERLERVLTPLPPTRPPGAEA